MNIDPSHIASEFAAAIEEIEVETLLDDEERFGECVWDEDPQTGFEERAEHA